MVALLHLENDLVPGAFTAERPVALELTESQAAISIENALLLGRERAARLDAEAARGRAERLFHERQRAEAEARFIAEASKTLAESLNYQDTLTRLARLAVPFLADWCLVDVVEEGRIRRIAGAHVDPAKEPLLQELEKRSPVYPGSPHPERLAPALSQAGCSVELRERGPVIGWWDYNRLTQVVTILLSNALKFGAGKPIEISIHEVDGRARLTMADHGIGIDPKALPQIFEKFERAVSTRSYGGLGLGQKHYAQPAAVANAATARVLDRLSPSAGGPPLSAKEL